MLVHNNLSNIKKEKKVFYDILKPNLTNFYRIIIISLVKYSQFQLVRFIL